MIDRREVLTAAAAVSALALLPIGAFAQAAAPAAEAKTADQLIAEFTGGADVAEGGVTLTAPEIAENGNTVPIAFDAPGASAVLVLASGNPTPAVATVNFGELAASQKASTRIRLAQTQDVIAVAKLADGTFGKATANIKVTIGGCGG